MTAQAHARTARTASTRWRVTVAGPLVALAILIWALFATDSVGLPVRDPDHVAALYLALVSTGVALLVGIDILIRAARRSGASRPRERRSRACGASAGPRGGPWPRAARWSAST